MKRPRRISLISAGVAVCLGAVALVATVASGGSVRQAAGHPCVVATGSGDAAFIRNFNPFQAGAQVSRDFTVGGIYENLVISTVFGGGHSYNVLAKSFAWSNGGKLLTINIQPNVKWSDGSPLTAADVAYSLNIGKQSTFADRIGLTGATSNIVSIKVAGKNKVAIRFKATDSTFIGSQLPNAYIVPKKIWSKVDVEKFTNPNPVGTGPFTKITRGTEHRDVTPLIPGHCHFPRLSSIGLGIRCRLGQRVAPDGWKRPVPAPPHATVSATRSTAYPDTTSPSSTKSTMSATANACSASSDARLVTEETRVCTVRECLTLSRPSPCQSRRTGRTTA